ncbi:MAG: hypothetical protein IPM77_15135 [Crocinitomicaceae bacterium]|nr:hypothetical protein [Crocinitomicaceae bacterium]
MNNIIYSGEYEGGLIRFDPKDSSVIQITMKDGLATNVIYSLFVDPDSNYLWLASPLALQRIDITKAEKFNQLEIETWDASSGFHPGYRFEFINDSILVTYSTHGYTEININHMHPEPQPKIHFTNVELFSHSVNWNNYNCKTDTSFGRQLPTDLVLDYDENNLTFYFQGVSCKRPLFRT